MIPLILALSFDGPLGKCTIDDLPQQALFELLTEGISETCNITEGIGRFADDFCTWEGVRCSNGIAVDISWGNRLELSGGQIDLRYVPTSVTSIDICNNNLTGTIECAALSRGLLFFDVESNVFTGTISLAHLPSDMKSFVAAKNHLSGNIDFMHLPQSLQEILLSKNKFTGSVDLSCLPKALIRISLSSNQLNGSLDFKNLPPKLKRLEVSENEFTGRLEFTGIPSSMRILLLRDNHFEGEADLCSMSTDLNGTIDLRRNNFERVMRVKCPTLATILLHCSGVTKLVDEAGVSLERSAVWR